MVVLKFPDSGCRVSQEPLNGRTWSNSRTTALCKLVITVSAGKKTTHTTTLQSGCHESTEHLIVAQEKECNLASALVLACNRHVHCVPCVRAGIVQYSWADQKACRTGRGSMSSTLKQFSIKSFRGKTRTTSTLLPHDRQLLRFVLVVDQSPNAHGSAPAYQPAGPSPSCDQDLSTTTTVTSTYT